MTRIGLFTSEREPGRDSPERVVELDACGLLCPLPVLKARKCLAAMEPGSILRLRTDDPAAPLDVKHFCREQGHVLLDERSCQDGATEFEVRKGLPS